MSTPENSFQKALNFHQAGQADNAMTELINGLVKLAAQIESIEGRAEAVKEDTAKLREWTAKILDKVNE